MPVKTRKIVLQTPLSVISEKWDQEYVIEEDTFDVDEIIRHLGNFDGDQRENVDIRPEFENPHGNSHKEKQVKPGDECENIDIQPEFEKQANPTMEARPSWRRVSDTTHVRYGACPNGTARSPRQGRPWQRASLPNIRVPGRRGSDTSLKFDQMDGEWRKMFNSLDKKVRNLSRTVPTPQDGHKDGRLHKKSLQSIMSTLESNSSWSLEYRTAGLADRIARQISHADKDNNGYLDKEEFADFVARLDGPRLDGPQDSREEQVHHAITGHMKTAAYASECRICPPPLFIPLTSLLQLGLFAAHVLQLAAAGRPVGWDGPAPLCSVLIFNPAARWQAWRFLSYSLVHSGYTHVLLNIVMQVMQSTAGSPVVPLASWPWGSHWSAARAPSGGGSSGDTLPRTALVYMMGVLAGSLATTCLDPHVYLAGASGGVYSLILAHLSTLILNWKEDVLIIRPKVS
jgi:membrane associated rhomboid family serine protease